ncbi:MAG TPA: outer membrane beta-barrel protein [Bradyrhizobium sp.]|nr:outer membrane beta-barrel protein [Bradyrhizobium sp.]
MKKIALAAAAVSFLFTGAASAADLAARPYTKAPPVIAKVYDWSGIYVGGAVGGIWNDTDGVFYNAPGFNWRTNNHSDWIAGGFAGIQKQWNNIVVGVEGGWNAVGDGWGSTIGNGIAGPCGFAAAVESCQARITDIGYIGGRLGFAWDRWMVYGQGGFARAHIESRGIFNATGVVFAPASADHNGWYAGVGFDYAVLDYLILGVDYKHYEFDSSNHNCGACDGNPNNVRRISATADSVMGRVSFKFNPWPTAPVVAKY